MTMPPPLFAAAVVFLAAAAGSGDYESGVGPDLGETAAYSTHKAVTAGRDRQHFHTPVALGWEGDPA